MRRHTALRWWFAASLGLVGGSLQSARAVHEPVERTPLVVPLASVMAVPPKPEGARPTGTGAERAATTWADCAALPTGLADACFTALAWERAAQELPGALAACEAVTDPERAMACVADVAERHPLVDRPAALALCPTLDARRWRDQCVFGIALAEASTAPERALSTCEEAGMWTRFCRHDVNGTRATADLEAALAYCAALAPAERPTCTHGIGKYVGRVDLAAALAACRELPTTDDLAGQCAHGAGWAAAEANGPAAAARCETTGPLRDSCLLGVAYHTKRTDRQTASSLCRRAQAPDERARCLAMVGRPALSLP